MAHSTPWFGTVASIPATNTAGMPSEVHVQTARAAMPRGCATFTAGRTRRKAVLNAQQDASAERPKLSDGGHETTRLKPRRDAAASLKRTVGRHGELEDNL